MLSIFRVSVVLYFTKILSGSRNYLIHLDTFNNLIWSGFLYSSPTPDQRRDVCRAIITKYPFLSDAGGGYVSRCFMYLNLYIIYPLLIFTLTNKIIWR